MALAKVVYASMTGNNEELAEIITNKLEELGHTVEMDECTMVEVTDFEDADICVVVTYTYDEGELPDEIVDFYEELGDIDLTGKYYGCAGSGDTFYDQFCSAVDDFDKQFALTGATKGAESVKVDLAADDEDIANLEKFAEQLSDCVN